MAKEIGGEPTTKHLQGIVVNGNSFYWAYDPTSAKHRKRIPRRHLWHFDGKKPYTLCGRNSEFPGLLTRVPYPKSFRTVCMTCYKKAMGVYCKQRKKGRISSDTNKPFAMTWRNKKLQDTEKEF
jgi:hypothetical protein